MATYERPGINGDSTSRICHGPIWFCVACRESGSNNPPHDPHSAVPIDCDSPQYGHANHPDPPASSTFAGTGSPDCDSDSSISTLHRNYTLTQSLSALTPVRFHPPSKTMHTITTPVIALSLLLTACTNTNPSHQPTQRILRSDDPAPATRSATRVSPPASLQTTTITWNDLHDTLVEAAGATALEEAVLDTLLAQEAANLELIITPVDIENEERTLLTSLDQNPQTAQQLLLQLRAQRALGPHRYQSLLRRTATMRAIVAPNVNLTEESLELARTIRFGEKHQLRIITAPSLIEAQTAIRALDRNEPFPEVAAKLSTDSSAPRGGLIEPLSLADPSYPAAVRTAARNLAPADISNPIAIEGGYAIIQLIEIIPANTPPGAELLLLEDARAEQERILMTQLARRLLAGAQLNIFDPALETAWNRRTNQ